MPFITLTLRDFKGLEEKGVEYKTIINTKFIININDTTPPTIYWNKNQESNSTTLSYITDYTFKELENVLTPEINPFDPLY